METGGRDVLTVPLDEIPRDEEAIIHSLEGGNRFLGRVSVMGFIPGTRLRVVRNGRKGPLIVRLRDTDVAIGRGEAMKIIMKESGDE